jgi:hypothetical protein
MPDSLTLTPESILSMEAGREMDALVAERVLGMRFWIERRGKDRQAVADFREPWMSHRHDVREREKVRFTETDWRTAARTGFWGTGPQPFSTDTGAAFRMLDTGILPLLIPFARADGWFHLTHSEDDDGSAPADCAPGGEWPEHGRIWTAHLHVRLIGEGSGCPSHWKHGDTFCAVAETRELAICRAALLAVLAERIPSSNEGQ